MEAAVTKMVNHNVIKHRCKNIKCPLKEVVIVDQCLSILP